MNNDIFDKYSKRLAKEGIIKAAICGTIGGFSVSFVISFIGWFFGSPLWLFLAIGIGVAIGVGAGFLLYHKLFRPSTKAIARRIDSLGLEERLITMAELESDESCIAAIQREDARAALGKVDPASVKFRFSRMLVIFAAVALVLGAAMTTVNGLTAYGILPTPGKIISPERDDDFFTVTYLAGEGGKLIAADGSDDTEFSFEVKAGESTQAVVAVANAGYIFDCWSDGFGLQVRFDGEIDSDIFVTATFVAIDDVTDEAEEGDGTSAGGLVGAPTGRPGNGSGGSAPRYEPSNRVYDGSIPYQDVFDEYYEEVLEELLNNNDLTPRQRAMLEAYYESLKSGVDSDSNN